MPAQPSTPTSPETVNRVPEAVEARQGEFVPRMLLLAIAFLVLLVYLATGAPGAWWGDGQELACAAWTLGIPHPTGYPLYMLTGHAAMKLMGWMDPGRALTVFSALLLAGAVWMLMALFRRLLGEQRPPHEQAGGDDLLPAIGAGLFIAFAGTLWDHATFAEVYPLTFLIGAGLLTLVWIPAEARPGAGRAAGVGALMGLGMLNHYSILALGPLAAVCVLRWTARAEKHRWRLPLAALAAFALMLTGYLYLPLRAAVNPPLNWGDPSNLERLIWVLTGGQYRERYVQAVPGAMRTGLAHWIYWWGTQWLPMRWIYTGPWGSLQAIFTEIPWRLLIPGLALGAGLVGLALSGLVRLALRRWELGWGLLGAVAATAVFAATYRINDIEPYFMIALPAVVVGWIVAGGGLVRRLPSRTARLWPLLRATPALLPLAIMVANFNFVNKSWDNGPAIYGQTTMKVLPPDALVVTGGDADIYSFWYEQMVRGKRPDVTVYGSRMIFSGWYQRYFDRPDRPKIPIFIEDRPLSKSDQIIYNVKLFRGVLLPNLAQGRPVFATYKDAFVKEYLQPKPAMALLSGDYMEATAYSYLPCPVLYKLQPNPQLARLSEAELTREFWNFALRRAAASRQRASQSLMPTY